MVDDGVYLVELDVEVDVVIDELWLDVDQLDPAELVLGLYWEVLGDVLFVATLDENYH